VRENSVSFVELFLINSRYSYCKYRISDLLVCMLLFFACVLLMSLFMSVHSLFFIFFVVLKRDATTTCDTLCVSLSSLLSPITYHTLRAVGRRRTDGNIPHLPVLIFSR
jgi:hypothetical protein